MLSAAAADVEDISDFIGSGGISDVDWTGIPLNKVTFLSFFSLFVPSAGKFALLEGKRKRNTRVSFCVLIRFFTLVILNLCVKPQLSGTEDKPRGFLTVLCSLHPSFV